MQQAPAVAPGRKRDRYKWVALAIGSMGSFMATLDAGTSTIAYPALSAAFNADISLVVWVLLSYLLVGTGLALTLGWVGDVVGRKRVYSLGFVIFALGLGLSALSQNISQLIGSRVLQGIGLAMFQANGYPLISAAFPPQERGKAFGLLGSVVGVGLAGGPALGGILLDTLGWRSLFYARVPLALAAAIVSWLFLKEDRKTGTGLSIDVAGALILFLQLAALLLTINQAGRLGLGSPVIWALASVALLLTAIFPLVEARAKRPVVDLRLLKVRRFSMTLLTTLLHFLPWGIITFISQFFLLGTLGFTPSHAGLLLAVFPSVRILAAPASGWLADRLPPSLIQASALLLMAAGAVLTARLGPHPGNLDIALAFVLLGFGSGFYEPANTTTVMGSVPPDRFGTAAASIVTTRQIGISSGAALGGTIYALREAAHRTITPGSTETPLPSAGLLQQAGAFHDTLIAAAALIFLAALSALAQGPFTRRFPRASQRPQASSPPLPRRKRYS